MQTQAYINRGWVRLRSGSFGSIRFGSVRFSSDRFDSVLFGSVPFRSVQFGSVRVGLVGVSSRCIWAHFGLYRLICSARLGSFRHTSVYHCSFRFIVAQVNLLWFISANLNLIRIHNN